MTSVAVWSTHDYLLTYTFALGERKISYVKKLAWCPFRLSELLADTWQLEFIVLRNGKKRKNHHTLTHTHTQKTFEQDGRNRFHLLLSLSLSFEIFDSFYFPSLHSFLLFLTVFKNSPFYSSPYLFFKHHHRRRRRRDQSVDWNDFSLNDGKGNGFVIESSYDVLSSSSRRSTNQ